MFQPMIKFNRAVQSKASKLVGNFCKYWFHILLLQCKCTENVADQSFDWPLVKIGLKMASGQLLFCALLYTLEIQ